MRVNLLGPSEATLQLPDAGAVRLEQSTEYPFDGDVAIRVDAGAHGDVQRFSVRIPQWAAGASIRVNGASVAAAPRRAPSSPIEREWRKDDVITLSLPMQPQAHRRTQQQRAGIARAGRFAGAPGSAALRLPRRHARPARVRDRT